MRSAVIYAFFVLSLVTPTMGSEFKQLRIQTDDGERSFWLFTPTQQIQANTAVLFVYHGDGGNAEAFSQLTGFNTFAESNNFIVVYPQAAMVGDGVRFNTYVDDAPGNAGLGVAQCVDDLHFTQQMLNWLSTTYAVTLDRVYATGHSGGGFMCYNLAMQMRPTFKAIAPVSASMWGNETFINMKVASAGWTPLPILHIHGINDEVVEYIDKDLTPKSYEEWPLFLFSEAACGATTYTAYQMYNGATRFGFCTNEPNISLVGVGIMGHVWTDGFFPTTEKIVEFFNLNSPTSVLEKAERRNSERPKLVSRDVNNWGWIDRDVDVAIVDIIGQTIYVGSAKQLQSSTLNPGVYLINHSGSKQSTVLVQ